MRGLTEVFGEGISTIRLRPFAGAIGSLSTYELNRRVFSFVGICIMMHLSCCKLNVFEYFRTSKPTSNGEFPCTMPRVKEVARPLRSNTGSVHIHIN